MSEKPAIYRLHGDKVSSVSFPSPPLKVDGDLPAYKLPGDTEPGAALSADVTKLRKANPGRNSDGT